MCSCALCSDALPLQEGLHCVQSGVFDMAGFGSPAVAAQDEGLIGAMPSSAPFRTFLQAVASQAQAVHDTAHAVIHSPWAPVGHHDGAIENPSLQQQQLADNAMPQPSSSVDASFQFTGAQGTAISLGEQSVPRFNLLSDNESLQHGSCRTALHDTECSLRRSDGPFGPGVPSVAQRAAVSLPSAEVGLHIGGTVKASTTHFPVGTQPGEASDSDMEESTGGIDCVVPESEDDEEHCMQPQTHGCSLQFERLAADLDNRFEALSMLSPDNQIPLLSRSLGRRVSVHGAHADTLEPWGRAAVFGCNTTSSGKLSIAASLAGEPGQSNDL